MLGSIRNVLACYWCAGALLLSGGRPHRNFVEHQPRRHWCACGWGGAVQVLVGLVTRDNMMVIIRRALAQGQRPVASMAAEIDYEDLNRNFVSAAARHLISEQQLAVLEVMRLHAHRPLPYPLP